MIWIWYIIFSYRTTKWLTILTFLLFSYSMIIKDSEFEFFFVRMIYLYFPGFAVTGDSMGEGGKILVV